MLARHSITVRPRPVRALTLCSGFLCFYGTSPALTVVAAPGSVKKLRPSGPPPQQHHHCWRPAVDPRFPRGRGTTGPGCAPILRNRGHRRRAPNVPIYAIPHPRPTPTGSGPDTIADAAHALRHSGGWFGPSNAWPTPALAAMLPLCSTGLVFTVVATDWWTGDLVRRHGPGAQLPHGSREESRC
jgi:hypothetical protein